MNKIDIINLILQEKTTIEFGCGSFHDFYSVINLSVEKVFELLKLDFNFNDRIELINKFKELKELKFNLENLELHEVEEKAEKLGLITIQGERQMRLAFN